MPVRAHIGSVLGIDTHKLTHVAAIVDGLGRMQGTFAFAATDRRRTRAARLGQRPWLAADRRGRRHRQLRLSAQACTSGRWDHRLRGQPTRQGEPAA